MSSPTPSHAAPRPARLALEDGSLWFGHAIGAEGTTVGEVVFNTSLTGYQEILTDPSYAGQIVVMTAPQIGNTGINAEDSESRGLFLRGLVLRELSEVVSNWRAARTLSDWLVQHGIVAIADLDTRALTRRLRARGSLKGAISTDAALRDEALVALAHEWPGLDGVDLVQQVSCHEPYPWHDATDPAWAYSTESSAARELHVVVYDLGVKYNTLRRLAARGCTITVVPATTSADEALALAPDGILLSNGPGDPAALPYIVETTRQLIGRLPLVGICMGHQILGQALGGTVYKLKFGHHGGNQPVQALATGRVEISAHNHNFAVDPQSLPPEVEVSHINLNDGCCEGLRHKHLPLLSVQYHPEAGPGPHDADPFFDEFIRLMGG